MKKIYSPKDISKMEIRELQFEGAWEKAFGRPSLYETWFIAGQSASGKSSFVMQLSKMLCGFGDVLYVSLEEGVSKSFQDRMNMFQMDEEQGRFRVTTDETMDTLIDRLKRRKSARFIILDSFQYTGWDYLQTKKLVDMFPKKSFIFVSQEDKGRPIGKSAVRLKYMAGVKVRTVGFRAYCQGRYAGDAATWYDVWPEKEVEIWMEK